MNNVKNIMKKIALLFVVLLTVTTAVHAVDLSIESVSYKPAPALPGQTFELFIQLKNNSQFEAKNVTFQLNLQPETDKSTFPFFFPLDEQPTKTFDSLDKASSMLVKYTVFVDPKATSGVYNVEFKFGDNGQPLKVVPFQITIDSRAPQVELSDVSPLLVKPGQSTVLQLTLKNAGNTSAFNVLTQLTPAAGSPINPLGSGSQLIDELKAGSTQVVSLPISVDTTLEQKTYIVPVQFTFLDNQGVTHQVTRNIGLRAELNAELDVVISKIVPNATTGMTDVTVELFNSGNSTAYNTVVEVSSPAFAELPQSRFFVGSIEKDDFGSFTFQAKLNSTDKPEVSVKTVYKDASFQEQSFTKDIQLQVGASASSGTGFFAGAGNIVLGIIVGIVLVFGYGYFRNRNKTNNNH